MKLAVLLTAAVLALGMVALGGSAAMSPLATELGRFAGGLLWWHGDATPARAPVVFVAGVGVLALTVGFLALRLPLVLRRR